MPHRPEVRDGRFLAGGDGCSRGRVCVEAADIMGGSGDYISRRCIAIGESAPPLISAPFLLWCESGLHRAPVADRSLAGGPGRIASGHDGL